MTTDWQSDVAVILAAHGDRGGVESARANASLLAHAKSLAASAQFRLVTAGVLKGEPALEAALAEARRSNALRIAVYPFFMADGYFVKSVLPARIEAGAMSAACRILAPLGIDEKLPPLILAEALAAGARAGFDPASTRLLVVGHGSALGPASANATRKAATHITGLGGFATVATAFLEEPPFLDAALAEPHPQTVVAGFFSGDGLHAGEDVPAAIAETGANAVYAGSIGGAAAIPGLILQALERTFAPG